MILDFQFDWDLDDEFEEFEFEDVFFDMLEYLFGGFNVVIE